MMIWNEALKPGSGQPLQALPRTMADADEGIFATTRVATAEGWQAAGEVMVGDLVLTHDVGMQPVVAVHQTELDGDLSADDPAEWPLFVPARSIGNSTDMIVMPGQWLLIESRLAARLLGAAHVMICAADLDSVRGVLRVAPSDRAEVIRFEFEDDQVIFGAGGALLACQGRDGLLAARARGMYHSYPRLTSAEADVILSQDILPAARDVAPRLI